MEELQRSHLHINKAFGHKYFPTNFSIANFSLIQQQLSDLISLLSCSRLQVEGIQYALIVFTLVAFVLWVALNDQKQRGAIMRDTSRDENLDKSM